LTHRALFFVVTSQSVQLTLKAIAISLLYTTTTAATGA